MPRKKAGHTKKASRNPAGRGSKYQGGRRQHLFFITDEAKDVAKTLAAQAGVPQGEFVETLIRRYGPDCTAVLTLERRQHEAVGEATGGLVGGAAVPDGPRSDDGLGGSGSIPAVPGLPAAD